MAVVIDLQGEIGWEIRPQNVADKLSRTNGEDIIVRLSTIGGDVFDGADIVNLFMDHRRDNPDVKMSLEVKAIAASYGSALMSAGVWDSIGVSRVSAFMMHSPSTFVFGDSQELQSAIDFLDGLSVMYQGLYSDQSGKSISEIIILMNAETWYFGQQIIDEGFADKIITMEDEGGQPLLVEPDNIDTTIILFDMLKKRDALMEKQKKKAKNEKFDVKRAAACLRLKQQEIVIKDDPGKPDPNIKPAQTGKSIQEVPVENKAELKKELPGVYDEVLNDGVMKEREEEKERRTALAAMKAKDEYKNIPEVVAVIDKGIVEGESVDEVRTMMNAVMTTLLNKPGKIDELESPGVIKSGDPAPVTMKTEKQREV